MTMIKLTWTALLMAVLLCINGNGLLGQKKDFQSWYEAGVKMGPVRGVDLSAEIEQRFKSNSTQYDRTLLTLAASYGLNRYMDVSGGVRMLMVADRELHLEPRYRVHADASGGYTLGDVDLTLRVRFQYGFEEFIYFNDFHSSPFVNRNRLKADYHIFGTRFGLFASLESWGLFASNDGRFFKRMRYSAGTSYAINFRSELSLRYLLEDEFNQANPLQSHILVLGFAYSL
jgi:hypothetical protein